MTMLDDATIAEARRRTAAVAPDAIIDTPPPARPAMPLPADETPALVPDRVRHALARRAAWRTALASIRAASYADAGPIRTAIEAADSDAILEAVGAVALAEWADANLGRLHTVAHGLNAEVDQELVNAVWASPRAVLANLAAASSDPTTEYIRQQAIAATTADPQRFDVRGQPAAPQVPVLSALSTVIPR